MNSYLASQELKDASGFYLNINFELLNGCKFKCRGCHVDTTGQEALSIEQFSQLKHLLQSFENSMYTPFIAFVGPTDFLVANNFTPIFSNPDTVDVFHKFSRLSLQTTYLDGRRMEEIARLLNEHYSNMELEINIVVDPAKIMDDRYLRIIEENKKTFLSLLKFSDVRSFGIMNVYDYSKTTIAELLQNYDFVHKRVEHLFETTVDYNFSLGRSADISNDEFLQSVFMIKNLFDGALISDNKAEYLRFSFGKLTDSLIERQYNYRNGKLYYSPLLYERFVTFRDDFEVPLKKYTAQEIEQFEIGLQMNQFGLAPLNEECADCTFVATCIDRGILHLMNSYGTTKCLVARKALNAVNGLGQYGN